MLKLSRFIPVLALTVLLFACGKSDSPSSITEKFLAAIAKADYDAAKTFGTADTDRLLNMMSGFKKMGAEPFMSDAKFDVVDESITGDEAKVTVKVDGKPKEMIFNLQKENGKWKVAMNKETINESDANIFNLGATNTDTTSVK
ncbi:MAG: DUF4878 domain-containing protein [Bacteroidetes bacterium]|nr:DUF4878 domain-containing protein [Bacteroidota bacterium]MBK8362336.1 DUF4878 domain-containing protein [Bacteroidota bacterium]MBL0032304.1 DUF4878 domain-containing protein [Bacteroidota bacterium]